MNTSDQPGLAWKLTPGTREAEAPVRVAVSHSAVTLSAAAADEPGSERPFGNVAQLAQTNIWVADVDLLFRDDPSTLTLLGLRFPSEADAQAFLTSVLTEFDLVTGGQFPPSAICSIQPGAP